MNTFFKHSLLLSLLLSIGIFSAHAADFKNGVTHINQKELAEKLKDPNSVLIDIRTKEEVDEGYIEGAIHLPISKIANDISILDPYLGKELIFYCHVGSRVNALTNYLQQTGHPSKNKLFHLKGDMRAWRARGNKVLTR